MSAFERHLLSAGIKVLNVFVLLSMLLTNIIGIPGVKAAAITKSVAPAVEIQKPAYGLGNYRAPTFARPVPRTEKQGISAAQLHAEQQSGANNPAPSGDLAIQCVDDYCPNTTPGTDLSETGSSVYYNDFRELNISTFDFVFLCHVPGCQNRNVYYTVTLDDTWSSIYARHVTASVGAGGLDSTNATGTIMYSYCGTGLTGECKLSTSGVIGKNLMGSLGQWANFTVFGWIDVGSLGVGDIETKTLTVEVSFDGISQQATLCVACSAYAALTHYVAGPINTHTGDLNYSTNDLSIPTSAGALTFQRSYASLATNLYTAPLGYGWTHNQDIRLIFPADPLGKAGLVIFKDSSGNMYQFHDEGGGSYIPAMGFTSTLTRSGSPTVYTIQDQSQNAYTFDANGKLQTWTDSQNRSYTYLYNPDGTLASVSADGGAEYLDLAYNSQGQLVTVSDQTGRHVSYSYSNGGDLTSIVDVLGKTWTYTYDSSHDLTSVVDPDGAIVERTEYDDQGRAIRQYDGDGKKTVELTYNADNSTTIKDALGNVSTDVYNIAGALESQTDNLGQTTAKSFDNNYRPYTITDPSGKTYQSVWSSDGKTLSYLLYPDGNNVSISYDALNNPTSISNRGQLSTYTYNGTLLTSATDALNGRTAYTYTSQGYLASETDRLGHTTSYSYDSRGEMISMTDPTGNTTHYAYDTFGHLVDTIDPLSRDTHNEYDAAGRLTRSTKNYDPSRPHNDANQYNIVTTYNYRS